MGTRFLAFLLVPAAVLTLTACSRSTPGQASASPAVTTPAVPAQAAPAPVPAPVPAATLAPGIPSSLREEVPLQDAGKVRAAIAAPSPVSYRVVNSAAPAGTDKNNYLDQFLAREGAPGPNDLVLLVFPADRGDIRFAMGAVFREKGVTVDELLGLVRTHYLPATAQSGSEDGLAALVQAVNDRMR